LGGFGDEAEVGVVANGEAAFVGEAEASGDVFREEGSGGEIVVEEERESVLNAGDAAPDGEEVVALFEIGRGRGVVGADGIDLASEEFLAEGVEGYLGAAGWGAFGEGADADGVGVGEEEIVRAGFDGDVDALFFGGVDEVDALGVGDVDDVESTAGFAGEIESERRRAEGELDSLTARLVEGGLASWAGQSDSRQLIVRGQANLLEDLRAMEDLERIRLLFADLETKKDVIELLSRAEQGEGVRIFIGSENKLFSLSGSSLVAAPFRDGSQKIVGVVGVIGPTRLNYARIVPMVDYTAKVVSEMLRNS
jgi:hypothetical protein